MKSLSRLFFLPAFVAMLSFATACHLCNGDYSFVGDVLFAISLYDKQTDENLLQILGRYNPDSVQIVDERGEVLYPGPVDPGGLIVWRLFSQITPPLDSALLQTYYLKLQHNGIDYDTLVLDYKVTTDDCNEQILAYIKLYYNGELVFDQGAWNDSITAHLYK